MQQVVPEGSQSSSSAIQVAGLGKSLPLVVNNSLPVRFAVRSTESPKNSQQGYLLDFAVTSILSATETLFRHVKVANSVAGLSNLSFPGIMVELSSEAFPRTLNERGAENRARILITPAAPPQYVWDYPYQKVYQYSHELVHTLALHTNKSIPKENFNSYPNLWLEETLAEVGSLFVMRKMGGEFASYADKVINSPTTSLKPGENLAAWIKQVEKSFSANPTDRTRNAILAKQLLPVFEKYPEGWSAVPYLRANKHKPKESIDKYIDNWSKVVPKELKPFVKEIKRAIHPK